MLEDPNARLQRMAGDRSFPHRDAAGRALRFRKGRELADLMAVIDDPHPCGTIELIVALAGAQSPWLNWVPMPTEAVANLANEVGRRRAAGEPMDLTRVGLSAAEPPSALTAFRLVVGAARFEIAEFPDPDIRLPLGRGRFAVWEYDGVDARPTVAVPSADAVTRLHAVANEPWASPLSGYLEAAPLGELSLDDLLGLLGHPPGPPTTPRWRQLAGTTPMYWYRLLQPWVCLGLLHHAPDEPWASSTRRRVLLDLSMGVEDWVVDSALFALVTSAYREPSQRDEARRLVSERFRAAMLARREVTILGSLAHLMRITPDATDEERRAAVQALAQLDQRDAADGTAGEPARRRWWPFKR